MKSYCTQNSGKCETCSLVNYGLDCMNNPVKEMAPIPELSRKGTKQDRALTAYDGFKGGATVAHIQKLVGKELCEKLTGHELGLVMSAVNRAWQEAKASTGAEVIDGDYVWVNALNKGYDLNVLRRLKETETYVSRKVPFDGNLAWRVTYQNDSGETRSPYEVSILPRESWQDWYRTDSDVVHTWELEAE